MGKLFFTSDEHYSHKNILKYCKRAYKNIDEMQKDIIQRHNSVVSPEDTVIHVGDIVCGIYDRSKEMFVLRDILSQLNGVKFLLRGNHDSLSSKDFRECGFEDVQDYLIINDNFITHYPLIMDSKWTTEEEKETFEIFKKSDCCNIIHGHSHRIDFGTTDGINRLNIGVDLNNFTPIESEKIFKELKNRDRKEKIYG